MSRFVLDDEPQAPSGRFVLDAPPQKKVYGNPTASRSEAEKMRREFVAKEGTVATRAKEGAKAVLKDAEPYYRPLLEGGGAAIGSIVGAGGGTVAAPGPGTLAGGVAGGALGYAMGKNVADTLSGDWAETPQDATVRSLKDIATGATYEMGGQAAGAAIGAAIRKAPAIVNAVRHPIQSTAENRAKQVLTSLADLAPQEAANAAKGEQLTSRLGVKLTPAQMTAKPATAAMEQGLATADPAFSATLTAQDNAAKDVALGRIRQAIGGEKPLPSVPDTGTIGQRVTEKLNATLDPIKKQERELWAKVPDYPIPSTNFDAAANALKSTPLEADTEAAVTKILDFANRMPKTTQGMQSIERTIGDKMTSGDANIRRVLGDLKKAIVEDFRAMGDAAESGDIAVHEGKVIHPSRLQAEQQKLTARIAEETAAAQKTPDIDAIRNALKDSGDSPNQWMRQVNETPAQYNNRLITRYHQNIGVDLPMLAAEEPASIAMLKDRIGQIDTILANAKPAENLSTAYRDAKDFSRTQKFDRFGKGAVSRVMQRGNEGNGLRLTDETVPRQFYTPSGADGLIKAVGKGPAKEQMKPYMVADMLKAAAPDGVTYNVQTGIKYIQKNRVVLEKLGLVDEARQILKEQMPAEIERMIAKRAPDAATGKQYLTSQDMRTILQKYGNTIKQLHGPDALQAFRDYNQLMGMIDRKNVVPRGGNSNTAEKAMNLANLMIKEATGPAKKLTDGLVGAMAQGAGIGTGASLAGGHMSGNTAALGAAVMAGRQMLKNADSQMAKAFVKILQDATLDPSIARDLMKLQRTGKVPATLQTIIDNNLIAATALSQTEDK